MTVGSGGAKLRIKNYASPDCGAKVIAANPEAASPSAILSPTRDDYMLNPCNVKIWFVVELCEPIQPQRVYIILYFKIIIKFTQPSFLQLIPPFSDRNCEF